MSPTALRCTSAPVGNDEVSPESPVQDATVSVRDGRRTSTKLIRFTTDELATVASLAAASGRPVACYIRENALGAKLKPRPGAISDTLVYQLGRVAKRLRDLADSATAAELPAAGDFAAALTELLETIRAVE